LIDKEVIFRLHQAAYQDRKAAYHFALIALRHLPHIFSDPQHNILLKNLKNYSTPLDFIEDSPSLTYEENHSQIAIQLAFLLCKPTTLVEILETGQNSLLQSNALFCLIKLGCIDFVEENLHYVKNDTSRILSISIILQYEKKQITFTNAIEALCQTTDFSSQRALSFLIEEALVERKRLPKLYAIEKIANISTTLIPQYIAVLLAENKMEEAMTLIRTNTIIPVQWKTFFDGCVVSQTKGSKQAIEYFQDHPCFYLFQSLFVENEGQLSSSYKKLFFWEKHELLYLLILFSYSSQDQEKIDLWSSLLKKEKKHVRKLYRQT
jgi:hypothetical protein